MDTSPEAGMDTDSRHVRLSALGIVAVSLFLALFVRLWFLQGIDRQKFEVASASNRLRVIHEEGPRGRILDRNGKVIVDNRTSRVVALDREPLRKMDEDERKQHFDDLAQTLTDLGRPTKVDLIQTRYDDQRYAPQEYVPIVDDVTEEVEIYLSERASRFPGVVVETRAVRSYPYGSLAGQVLGYVGETNEKELAAKGGTLPAGATTTDPPATTTTIEGVPAKPYQPGDLIGKSGVEQSYEDYLRAVPGSRTIEVNAKGDLIDVVKQEEAQPGDDIWLSIDIDLQAQAERLLAAKIDSLRGRTDRTTGAKLNVPQGSVVIQEPMTGQILAMASYPPFDPAQTVNGISSELWSQLNDPANGRPLYNWALQGAYAPGSTFKPFTAYAAMSSGLMPTGNESYVDNGVYKLKSCKGTKCEYQNAGRSAHGRVNIPRSLTVSSDVFYYWIGEQFWVGRDRFGNTPIQDSAKAFGLGERTGIKLIGENQGRMPTPEARREAYEANPEAFATGDWYTGDNIITAIGQGDVLVTPLQLADAYATLANGGTRYRPQIVSKVTRSKDAALPPAQEGNYDVVTQVEPEPLGKIEMTPVQYNQIVSGLLGVTQSGEGTASASWRASPTAWPMAGKTGTAQVKGKADTALFAGWGPVAPGGVPQYAISVIVPEAGFGGDVAAPLAFRILEPASTGQLVPACTLADQANCSLAAIAANSDSQRDVGSGGPG
jgi:penicillin-binding protein 2